MTAPAPAATVNIPAVGPVKRTYVIVGAVAVVGLVYLYFRRKGSSASVTGIDTTTGTAAVPDTGYVNPVPVAGPPSGPLPGSSPVDNGTWSQAAVGALVQNGWNNQFAATGIGRYLGGQQLSQEEVDMVRAAFALVGPPPQPLAIISAPTSATDGNGTTGGDNGGTGGGTGYTTITVLEGNHVNPLLERIHAYQPNFSLADLQALNPGVHIAMGNPNGYISATNPDTGNSEPIFNVGTSATVKIPTQ